MKKLAYTTPEGLKYQVLLPDHESESNARLGIRVGPPELTSLNLPKEIEKRLNNALFNRSLLTREDVRRRPQEVVAAWQSVLGVDVTLIIDVYRGGD